MTKWNTVKGVAHRSKDWPFWIVYVLPGEFGSYHEIHDPEPHKLLTSARRQGKATDHPIYEIWDDAGKLVEAGEQGGREYISGYD